jgi:pyruvate-formate lyase-activating enzyme
MRRRFPDMEITLVTNGNADIDAVPIVSDTFDRVVISIYGFQPETYRKITGLDLDKTLRFAEELIKNGRCKVNLKYLTTPINLHETNLFLHWASRLLPERIIMADSNISQYINTGTSDRFWEKIEERTRISVQEELRGARSVLKGSRCAIVIDSTNRKRFGIEGEFMNDEVFSKHITTPAQSRSLLLSNGTGLM